MSTTTKRKPRPCSVCGEPLPADHEGNICPVCSGKRRKRICTRCGSPIKPKTGLLAICRYCEVREQTFDLLSIKGPATIDLSVDGQANETATLDTVWAKYDELERLRDEMYEQLATLNDQISLAGEYCSLTGRLLPRPVFPYDADENDESEGGGK